MKVERVGRALRVELDGRRRVARVHDLSDRVPLERVRAAIPDPWVVTSDPPSLTRSLARAARSRGRRAPQADRIAELEAALDDSVDVDPADSAHAGVSTDATDRTDPATSGNGASGETDGAGVAVDRRVSDGGTASESADGERPTDAGETVLAAARRRVAEADADVDRLRERVATLRGRVVARREAGVETESVESELTSAMRELTEAETERIAARESLERARRRVRERRDERERRLRRRDELRNRRREARAWLADRVTGEFRHALRAVRAVCGGGDPDVTRDASDGVASDAADDRPWATDPEALVADPVTGRLAAATVAADDAPVVLAVDRDPQAVAACLDRPVIRV
ncbi:MAG: hypothetical protein ABEI75_02785 [Halobaculum sp.]